MLSLIFKKILRLSFTVLHDSIRFYPLRFFLKNQQSELNGINSDCVETSAAGTVFPEVRNDVPQGDAKVYAEELCFPVQLGTKILPELVIDWKVSAPNSLE